MTRLYPDLPFRDRLPFDLCEGCGEKHLDGRTKKIIDDLNEWMHFEHTGKHRLDSLESIDHYKGEKGATSILGDAPKGIYTNADNGKTYLIK